VCSARWTCSRAEFTRCAERRKIGVAGRVDGIVVGSVRGADTWIDFSGGGFARTECAYDIFAVGVCGGGGYFAGACAARGEQSFCGDEAIAWRRGMDPRREVW